MLPVKISAGTKVLLGAPAQPMPHERSDAVASLVASIEGILEAHLPQCFLVGVMEAAAQVLVVVIKPNADQEAVLRSIGLGLSNIMPAGAILDVWPMRTDDVLLTTVRGAKCEIFAANPDRHWWKFW